MEKLKTKTRMTAAERKRKSLENKFKKMTEKERVAFKKVEKERIRKDVQTHLSKKKDNKTTEDLKDYKKKEAFRIKALWNKKVSTEHSNIEKAKTIFKVTKKPLNPYKNQQRFSKVLNDVRSRLPISPQKQAAVVSGLASEYGYQFGGKKHKSVTNETQGLVERLYYRTDIARKRRWDDKLDRGR